MTKYIKSRASLATSYMTSKSQCSLIHSRRVYNTENAPLLYFKSAVYKLSLRFRN